MASCLFSHSPNTLGDCAVFVGNTPLAAQLVLGPLIDAIVLLIRLKGAIGAPIDRDDAVTLDREHRAVLMDAIEPVVKPDTPGGRIVETRSSVDGIEIGWTSTQGSIRLFRLRFHELAVKVVTPCRAFGQVTVTSGARRVPLTCGGGC